MPGFHCKDEKLTIPSQKTPTCAPKSSEPLTEEPNMVPQRYFDYSARGIATHPTLQNISKWLAAHQHVLPSPGVGILKGSRRKHGGLSTRIYHPSELDPSDVKTQAQAIFHVEWTNTIGPRAEEPIPPAILFIPQYESSRFPFLFKRVKIDMGCVLTHYMDVQPYPGSSVAAKSFEEYVVFNLQNHNRFKLDVHWLLWVLMRTEDRCMIAMINCVLVMFHDCKARHLGQGRLEVQGNLRYPFLLKQLVDGQLV